jgi:membrane protein required for colicin V production
MQGFNWVDYVILAIFLFSMLAGLSRGFVREMISLITLIAAFVVATMFSNAVAQAFTSAPSVQSMVGQASSAMGVNASQSVSYAAIAISFALLFAGTVLLGSIVSYFVGIAFQTGILGFGNRILGAGFGLVRGFIMNLVLIFIVQLTPFASQPFWQQSQLVESFQPAVVWLGNIVSPSLANLKARFGETIQNVGSQIQGITNTYTGSGGYNQ